MSEQCFKTALLAGKTAWKMSSDVKSTETAVLGLSIGALGWGIPGALVGAPMGYVGSQVINYATRASAKVGFNHSMEVFKTCTGGVEVSPTEMLGLTAAFGVKPETQPMIKR